MIRAAWLAFADLFDRRFRWVLLKALGLTLALLVGLGALLHAGLKALPHFEAHWLNVVVRVLGDLGIVLGSIVLAMPVAALCVGFFLDDAAVAVERKRYPAHPPGRSLELWPTVTTTLAFLFSLITINLLVLPLYLVPGANLLVWLLVNGALLGREYFELAALRHAGPAAVKALRRRYRLRVFLYGVLIALALSVPILNLLAPLFGTAFMVHLYKTIGSPDDQSLAPHA